MKYVKILGLLAVAAAALMAFAGTASATTLTSPEGVSYTGVLHAESEESAVPGTKHVRLQNPIATISCNSTVEGPVEEHGSTSTAGGKLTTLDWTNCTNSWHVTTVKLGSLELHSLGGGVGTLTSTGTEVDTTRLGVTCVYKTKETDIGKVTDSTVTGKDATLHIEASIPIEPEQSSGLCGSGNAKWEGAYTVTKPNPLHID